MLNTVLCGILMLCTSPVEAFFEASVPRRVRSHRQFAEEELVLPTGPREGLRVSASFMPWSGLVLDEFDRGLYTEYYATGPTQSGKTLLFLQHPVLYHLFELGEDVGLAAPTVEQAREIYEERILPMIERSRFKALLPTRGAGSRKGKPRLSVVFANGARLRFIGAKTAAGMASYTLRVVVMTEIDKMLAASTSSPEADPVRLIVKRTSAWGSLARVYGECTVTTSQGRIWREVTEFGTYTRPHFPCPHCGEYFPLEREALVGWQEAPDVLAAMERAGFQCAACRRTWSEADRAAALARPVAVSRGQTINAGGEVLGPRPRTRTFGFRWTGMASALLAMADLAKDEWVAEKAGTDDAEKGVRHSVWAMPYDGEVAEDLAALTREAILAKAAPNYPRGVVPSDAVRLIVSIDPSYHVLWWMAGAWMPDARCHIVAYGGEHIPQERQASALRILSALRTFRDTVLKTGFAAAGLRQPDVVVVDSGWNPDDVVYTFVLESGQPLFLASKGRGSGRYETAWRTPSPASSEDRLVDEHYQIVRQPSGIRLFEVHSDHWKRRVHDGFRTGAGARGAFTIFHAPAREHRAFADHILAEREEREFVEGQGWRTYWNVVSRTNHWLDCAAYNAAVAHWTGIRMNGGDEPPPAAAPSPGPPLPARSSSIRREF